MKLTQRQETFCLKYFELGNASEAALIAGYSPRTVRAIASINLTKLNIQARLRELNKVVEDASIATVVERKQRLTTFAREDNITDKGSLARGGNIQAITELNKMEKIYSENTVNILNINVENLTDEQLAIIAGKDNPIPSSKRITEEATSP